MKAYDLSAESKEALDIISAAGSWMFCTTWAVVVPTLLCTLDGASHFNQCLVCETSNTIHGSEKISSWNICDLYQEMVKAVHIMQIFIPYSQIDVCLPVDIN